jgi:hypothetical protein
MLLAVRFGEVQTSIIVTMVYILVLGPMACIAGLARKDLLHKRGLRESGSAWNAADTVARPELERARRLF